AQAAQGGGGEHGLGSSADAHHRVDGGAAHGGGDSVGEVAVADQTDAGAGAADVLDQLAVAGSVQHHDGQVVDVAGQGVGDVAQVLGYRSVQVDAAGSRGADHDLVHIGVGGVQQSAAFGGGEHRDGPAGAGG